MNAGELTGQAMKQFEILDISGDAGIRVFGSSLQEIFLNAATGMYSLITDLSRIQGKRSMPVTSTAPHAEGLLVSWLNELIFHFDTTGFIGAQIRIDELIIPSGEDAELHACSLQATLTGEDFDPEKHEGNVLLKAATYHRLKIQKAGDLWQAEVIFDI